MHGDGVAACGDDDEGSSGAATSRPPPQSRPKKLKVGMVTDIGGLNDRSFNQSAYKGLQRAEKELGAEIRVITSKSNADYVPNLSTLARQQYDLVIAVGFLMAEATETVAKSFPNTNFAIIDYPQAGDEEQAQERRGPPVQGERGRLPRRLHGRPVRQGQGRRPGRSRRSAARRSRRSTPTSPATRRAPTDANPDIKSLYGYSEDFVAQDKCKELALNQIAEGSQVVFQVAGQCGLGALDAAKQEGVQGIGVDADQGYLGDHIMTSALKKVDEAVFTAVQQVQDGAFKGGTDTVFDVKSGGVGFGKTNAEGAKFTEQVDAQLEKIAAGELTDIPTKHEVALTERPHPLALELKGVTKRFGALDGERQRRLRPAPRRGARPARGERGGQVDAHERPLRAPPARRGRDPSCAASRCRSARRARRSGCGSAWCTSTSC